MSKMTPGISILAGSKLAMNKNPTKICGRTSSLLAQWPIAAQLDMSPWIYKRDTVPLGSGLVTIVSSSGSVHDPLSAAFPPHTSTRFGRPRPF